MAKLPDGKASMTLSIRLLRIDRTVDQAFRPDHGLEEKEADGARLFVLQSDPVPPSWQSFVGEFSRHPLDRLSTQNCGALLFMEITTDDPEPVTRTMAIAFGSAFHALDPNAFERSFGLRVALNSMPRANLRNLDVATLDATTMQKRI